MLAEIFKPALWRTVHSSSSPRRIVFSPERHGSKTCLGLNSPQRLQSPILLASTHPSPKVPHPRTTSHQLCRLLHVARKHSLDSPGPPVVVQHSPGSPSRMGCRRGFRAAGAPDCHTSCIEGEYQTGRIGSRDPSSSQMCPVHQSTTCLSMSQ